METNYLVERFAIYTTCYTLSRLKGMETHCYSPSDILNPQAPCYTLSRLKGMETCRPPGDRRYRSEPSCYTLSRLKGMETNNPLAQQQSLQYLLHTFPFERNGNAPPNLVRCASRCGDHSYSYPSRVQFREFFNFYFDVIYFSIQPGGTATKRTAMHALSVFYSIISLKRSFLWRSQRR